MRARRLPRNRPRGHHRAVPGGLRGRTRRSENHARRGAPRQPPRSRRGARRRDRPATRLGPPHPAPRLRARNRSCRGCGARLAPPRALQVHRELGTDLHPRGEAVRGARRDPLRARHPRRAIEENPELANRFAAVARRSEAARKPWKETPEPGAVRALHGERPRLMRALTRHEQAAVRQGTPAGDTPGLLVSELNAALADPGPTGSAALRRIGPTTGRSRAPTPHAARPLRADGSNASNARTKPSGRPSPSSATRA